MMKEMKIGTYIHTINGQEEMHNFNFYTNLSSANKLKFVNSVVGSIIDENHYDSIIKNLIFDFYIIDIMTDFDTTQFTESSSFIDDVEQFLEETNIVDIVKANASPVLFEELNNAIDNSIRYLTGIHPNPFNESLASLVNTLEKKVNEIDLDNMMNVAQKLIGVANTFTVEDIVNAYIDNSNIKN